MSDAATSLKPYRYGQLVDSATLQAIVQTIAGRLAPEKIILFGSYATGSPTADSDLDLLVVMESTLPRHERAAAVRSLFRPCPCPMDILVYTPAEVAYWNGTVNHIVTEAIARGRVVYERT